MTSTNLVSLADSLPIAWRSTVLSTIGQANLKVLRMDGAAHEEEAHPYDEALLVLEGELRLRISGLAVKVLRHELYVIPAGVRHAVEAGSFGCLVIVDPAGGRMQQLQG